MATRPSWFVFDGAGKAGKKPRRLPDPPPWREPKKSRASRAETWQPADEAQLEIINAALILRRPLLVTGPPGAGKSSVAHAIARELGLGAVLEWPVNSKSVLRDGLYMYDAIARLRDAAPIAGGAPNADGAPNTNGPTSAEASTVARYLRLGALGTALATSKPGTPRVLLIDELDKADVDLPNDLLHVLENGDFEIPELQRAGLDSAPIRRHDEETVDVNDGRVCADEHPVVVITSNGEREFSPAFLRRCIRLDVRMPTGAHLQQVLDAHLGGGSADGDAQKFVRAYEKEQEANRVVAVDQILALLYLHRRGGPAEISEALQKALLRELGER